MDYDEEASARSLLERMLLDSTVKPTNLPLSLLKDITNNFSNDHRIGEGGFAVVYKGILQNGTVAVKKLSQAVDLDEKNFNQEVSSLIKVEHKNVVRFLGYCADTQGKVEKYEEKMVMADVRQRLLCFEFLPNGGLDKHINDAPRGLEWRTRYHIIKGICEGLHYLHQQNIVHLDLKPANILLDCNMVPKIADFGLSKCFDEKQTRAITSKVIGTQGYMAPEFFSGVITLKSDIYSLGIIISEILTGQKGNHPIENVLDSWSTRFRTSQGGTWLEHVRVCAEIGFQCMDSDPAKRPITRYIIDKLDKLERAYGFIETNLSATHPLDVHPLELRFPLEPNKTIEFPVTLTNRTDRHVGVLITPTCPDTGSGLGFRYSWEDSWDDKGSFLLSVLGPRSSKVVYMTMRKRQQPPLQADKSTFKVVMIAMESEKALRDLELSYFFFSTKNRYQDLLKKAKESGTEVYRATLRAVTCDPASCEEVVTHKNMPAIWGYYYESFQCMDVNPTEGWVLVGDSRGYVCIWNYEKKDRIMMFNVANSEEISYEIDWDPYIILSIKFITRERWFAAGDAWGWLKVYAYTTKDKIKEFKPHDGAVVSRLAVHPTDPLLVTASHHMIKLWDWGQDWICTRVLVYYGGTELGHLTVSPMGLYTAAAGASYHGVVKVWDVHSSDPIAKFKGSRPTFYTDGHRQFLVTISGDGDANIYDLETKERVHTLHEIHTRSNAVACHPRLPILATIKAPYTSHNKRILFWDARTYRLKKMVELSSDGDIICMVFTGTDDFTRLVVASMEEISIINIDFPALLIGGGN